MDQNLRVITFLVLPLVGATAHLLFDKAPQKRKRITEIFLLYWLAIAIGVSGLFAFVGHFFLSDFVAQSIGWPAGNPFQLEVAFTNLALGVLGVLSIWYRRDFWMATAIGATVFLFGANYVHLKDMVEQANYAPGNAGLILVSNFLKPVVLFGLLIIYKRVEKADDGHFTGKVGAAYVEKKQHRAKGIQGNWQRYAVPGLLLGVCFAGVGAAIGAATGEMVLWMGVGLALGLAIGVSRSVGLAQQRQKD